jgi:DNA repair exonuclease SbcCD ATPase subunit
MIKFETIRYKNFLSAGNFPIEIDLTASKRTLFIGKNGAGKSSMIDAICFALFGKMYRNINKAQIINSINEKDCVVECEFSIASNKYKIVRGIKPNVFEIYHNDKLINQDAKTRDYQKYLEKNILNLNYKSFTQIVILGSTNYKPFMQLTAQERREVIEDLLDIHIFSDMNDILKIKLNTNKTELSDLSNKLSVTNTKHDSLNNTIQKLSEKDELHKQELEESIRQKTEEGKTIAQIVTKLGEEKTEKLNGISEIENIRNQYNKMEKMKAILENNKNTLNKLSNDISKIDVCTTCLQKVCDDHKQNIVENNAIKMAEIEKTMSKATLSISSVLDRLNSASKVQSECQSIDMKLHAYNTTLISLLRDINSIQDKLSQMNKATNTSDAEYQKELSAIKISLNKLKQQIDENKTHKTYLEYAQNLLKDKGIKARIISEYLPTINTLINNYLKELDFFVGFNLDENFKESIKSRHRDEFSYNSFSEGQKFRINIAILLTWREIAKKKNSMNTNLLVLDEVFDSSLDNSGVGEFTKLLNALSQDDTNIFVISHRGEEMVDKFDRVLEFSTDRDFSIVKEV